MASAPPGARGPPSTREVVLQAAAQVLGPESLETVDLPNVSGEVPDATKTLPGIPTCITQDSIPQNLKPDPAAIMIGMEDEIPRWKPGSVVRWSAWRMGFDSQDDANYAAIQVGLATEKWNAAGVGITFEYVALARDANFVVCHGGPKGSVLASAYFPNGKDLNYVFVYSAAFDPGWKENLWKVLTHELGHVLGLRHEFAMDAGRMFEGHAVQLGQRNPLSVMNYRREPPEIQPSDVAATKEFYKLPVGTKLSETAVADYLPR